MTLRRYRLLAIVTTVGICVLVVAGGVVRLTGSGLGCDDWPRCNATRLVDVSTGHAAIEQLNRLLSAVVGLPTLALAVVAVPLGRRVPGLRWPAFGVLAAVLGNGVVGGIAVRRDLHPALVQSHFLLAMVAIAFGLVAIRRSAPTVSVTVRESKRRQGRRTDPTRVLAVALGVITLAALVTGTVVTGTGPHAGEEDVRRFGFDISNVARIHSGTVLAAVALALVMSWTTRRSRSDATTAWLSAWMFVAVVQGGIGYVQYFNGVPEVLVGAHLAGATALWVVTVWLVLVTGASASVPSADVRPPADSGSEDSEGYHTNSDINSDIDGDHGVDVGSSGDRSSDGFFAAPR